MQLTSPMPPFIYVQQKIGPQLDSMGAKVQDDYADNVEIRLPDPKAVMVANAAFKDAIDGVNVTWTDSKGHGVRGVAPYFEAMDAVGKLAGVNSVMNIATVGGVFQVHADSEASAANLKSLLRTEIHGVPVEINAAPPEPSSAAGGFSKSTASVTEVNRPRGGDIPPFA